MTEAIGSVKGGSASGILAFVLLVSAFLALPVSLLLLRLYRRAVIKTMCAHRGTAPRQQSAPLPDASEYAGDKRPLAQASEVLYRRAVDGQRGTGIIYAVSGMLFAAVLAVSFLVSGGFDFVPMRFLILWWTYAWPVVLTLNLLFCASLRRSLTVAALYLLGFAAICLLAVARNPGGTAGSLVLLWLIENAPATVLLVLFLKRGIRAVGPLVLVFMVAGITGANALLSVSDTQEGILRFAVDVGRSVGLNATGVFLGLILVGFVLLSFAGWALLRWIAVRYERKKLSDQSLAIDALWLFFGVVYAIELVPRGLIWMVAGPAAFATFKLAYRLMFSFRSPAQPNSMPSPRLLWLRVFSLGRRSERLYDTFGGLWRFTGSISMIAGPDLATTTIEPHEFLRFARGKLAGMFIDGAGTLERRVSEVDLIPDFDGRFRVSEFFCYDNTWRMAFRRLANASHAVLMDLRGFSPRNAGCKFEIQELFHLIQLSRMVFVVDSTTDRSYLDQVLKESRSQMGPKSPNHNGGEIRFVAVDRIQTAGVRRLLATVCDASVSEAASAASG